MYLSHWGLCKPPFPSGLESDAFYTGASQREALARLRFLVEHRRRFGLMLGAIGIGKTLLLNRFCEECRESNQSVADVDLFGLSAREFFWQLGNKLHVAIRVEDDTLRLFRQLNDRFSENILQQKPTILLLDDLDQVGPDLLSQILRLLRTEAAQAGWLTLIAAASPRSAQRLGQAALEAVDLRVDLFPWDELDTAGYLQTALVEAGADRPLFDDSAMSELFRRTDGIPRKVTRLADAALLAGAASHESIIDASLIAAADEAISLPLATGEAK